MVPLTTVTSLEVKTVYSAFSPKSSSETVKLATKDPISATSGRESMMYVMFIIGGLSFTSKTVIKTVPIPVNAGVPTSVACTVNLYIVVVS